MEAQKPLEQEMPETTPQEVPTATIPQPESTPAANMEADPIPVEMDASPESPAKKTAGKLAALIGGGIVAVLGIFYLVLCIVSASHGTILGRTDVMGVDMSGLTVPQAQERWQQKGQAVCQATQLPLTLDGETAGQVSLWELGVSVTPETAAQLAYDAGHSGHFLENGWSLLRSWFRETSLTPPWTADDAALQEKAAELAEQLDVAAVDGACRLEQGKEDGFLVTVPKNGRKIDLRRLTDALRAALASGTLEPVVCAYEVVTAKPVDFDAFAETYATAKNASYNAAADQVEEGTVQVTFDADAAQKLVAQAQPGQEITVPAQIQQPKVSKAALETLRQPLEDGFVTITRASGSLTLPSRFMLVCAMNPCRCGWYGHPSGRCTCSPQQVEQYMRRISGPLLDRIDMHIDVPSVEYEAMRRKEQPESSADVRARVNAAREVQKKRYAGTDVSCNAYMTPAMIGQYCALDAAGEKLMQGAFDRLGLTGRSHDRILRMARTIADLEGAESIEAAHLAEAIQYRSSNTLK